jgi:hypothetical protein
MSTQTAHPFIWLALVSTRFASPGGSAPSGTAADVALRRFANSCRILELLKSMRAQGYTDMAWAKNEDLDNGVQRATENSTPTSFRQWCGEVLKPAVAS